MLGKEKDLFKKFNPSPAMIHEFFPFKEDVSQRKISRDNASKAFYLKE